MENLLIIFFSIVRLLVLYGMLFLDVLAFPGLCLIELRSCSLVGGRGATLRVRSFGRWCPFASCDVFGGKEMIGASRI